MLSKDYSVSASCAVLGLPRSSYYHSGQPRDRRRELCQAIEQLAGRHPTYGSRRIAAQLGRAPYKLVAGRHLVRQLMRELHLSIKPKRRRGKGTDSQHGYRRYPNLVKGLRASRPNHIWVADLSYLRLGAGFIYLAIVMDVYTRAVRGWHLSRSSAKSLTLTALRKALRNHPAPDVHHSDQGSQYAAHDYVKLLRAAGTRVSMSAAGEPSENGYAERLIRTIKEEEVYLSDYQSLEEARRQLGHFIDVVYNQQRVHSAIGYQTPAECEAAWNKCPLKVSVKTCPI